MKLFIVELGGITYTDPKTYIVVAKDAIECRELVKNNNEFPEDAYINSIEEQKLEQPGIIYIEYSEG